MSPHRKLRDRAYEAREKQNQAKQGANKTRCLGCRTWGHVVANCPDAKASFRAPINDFQGGGDT